SRLLPYTTLFRSRVGPRGTADGGLVDFDDLVYMLQTGNFFIGHGFFYPVEIIGVQDGVEGFVDEGRFSAARNPGHPDHFPKGKFYRDIFKVITGTSRKYNTLSVSGPSLPGDFQA